MHISHMHKKVHIICGLAEKLEKEGYDGNPFNSFSIFCEIVLGSNFPSTIFQF